VLEPVVFRVGTILGETMRKQLTVLFEQRFECESQSSAMEVFEFVRRSHGRVLA
jgi:hypothetical protein